jgi:hypothetical protein
LRNGLVGELSNRGGLVGPGPVRPIVDAVDRDMVVQLAMFVGQVAERSLRFGGHGLSLFDE